MSNQTHIDKADSVALRIKLDSNGCWEQPLLNDILTEIEQIDSSIKWQGSTNGPTRIPIHVLSGSVNKFYIKFTKATKLLSITDQPRRNQGLGCCTFANSQKFLDAITSSVATVTTSPTAMKDRIVGHMPNAALGAGVDVSSFYDAMGDLERLDSSITWLSGDSPTQVPRQQIQRSSGGDLIAFDLTKNKLHFTTSVSETGYHTRICKDMDEFVKEIGLVKGSVPVFTPPQPVEDCSMDSKVWIKRGKKQPQSDMWNCKCAECGSNAYQSPFSFECENGCKNSRGVNK